MISQHDRSAMYIFNDLLLMNRSFRFAQCWRKYTDLLLNKKGSVPQSNNTLLQVQFYIKFGQKYLFLFFVKDYLSKDMLYWNVISDQKYQTIHWAWAKHGHTAEMYCGKWYNNNGKCTLDSLFHFGFLVYFVFCFGLKIGKHTPVFNV